MSYKDGSWRKKLNNMGFYNTNGIHLHHKKVKIGAFRKTRICPVWNLPNSVFRMYGGTEWGEYYCRVRNIIDGFHFAITCEQWRALLSSSLLAAPQHFPTAKNTKPNLKFPRKPSPPSLHLLYFMYFDIHQGIQVALN
jgi:hypothetical protein